MHHHPENGHAGDEQEPQNVGGVPLRPQGHRDRVLGKVEEGGEGDVMMWMIMRNVIKNGCWWCFLSTNLWMKWQMAESKVAPPFGIAFSPPKNQVGLKSLRSKKFKMGWDELSDGFKIYKLNKNLIAPGFFEVIQSHGGGYLGFELKSSCFEKVTSPDYPFNYPNNVISEEVTTSSHFHFLKKPHCNVKMSLSLS